MAASAADTSATASSYGAGASWPSILADLSTRPAPIPHALLLSFIFRAGSIMNLLPQPASGPAPTASDCSLIIAPRLTKLATNTSDTEVRNTMPPPSLLIVKDLEAVSAPVELFR